MRIYNELMQCPLWNNEILISTNSNALLLLLLFITICCSIERFELLNLNLNYFHILLTIISNFVQIAESVAFRIFITNFKKL